MTVEVVYALPQRQLLVTVQVPVGATALEAVEASGILQQCAEIDLTGPNKLGIFGRLASAETVLRAGDRIEIYRPLKIDPKSRRRARARHRA